MNAHTKKLLTLLGITSACFAVSEEATAQQRTKILKKTNTINSHNKISPQAVDRMKILTNAQIDKSLLINKAKANIYGNNGYSDFFVESGGGSWHEAFSDSVNGGKLTSPTKQHLAKSPARLDFIKGVAKNDGYSDFFVDDGSNPWHEAFSDSFSRTQLLKNPGLRAKSMQKLSVIEAFHKMKVGKTRINKAPLNKINRFNR